MMANGCKRYARYARRVRWFSLAQPEIFDVYTCNHVHTCIIIYHMILITYVYIYKYIYKCRCMYIYIYIYISLSLPLSLPPFLSRIRQALPAKQQGLWWWLRNLGRWVSFGTLALAIVEVMFISRRVFFVHMYLQITRLTQNKVTTGDR